MSNLTTVTIASGQPASTTNGTVSTIDALMADGGQATIGHQADAANSATDATPLSLVAVIKQVSKSIQSLVTNVGSLATGYGQTSSRVDAAASTNATSLKGTAGNVSQVDVFNVAAYDVYLKFYNKASAPTVGTDTPVWTIPIKAGTGFSRSFPTGKWFSTGIAYAITKLQADTDTTVLVAHDVTGSIDWV